jgi:uncharacterized membrane protein YecN with MAPEG domain
MIYTLRPPLKQTIGYVEVVPQALLLSVILCYWVNHPKKWMNWALGILFFVMVVLPTPGLLMKKQRPR